MATSKTERCGSDHDETSLEGALELSGDRRDRKSKLLDLWCGCSRRSRPGKNVAAMDDLGRSCASRKSSRSSEPLILLAVDRGESAPKRRDGSIREQTRELLLRRGARDRDRSGKRMRACPLPRGAALRARLHRMNDVTAGTAGSRSTYSRAARASTPFAPLGSGD